MKTAYHFKENEILKPPGARALELFKAVAVRAFFKEGLRSFAQQRKLGGLDRFEIDAAARFWRGCNLRHAIRGNPAAFGEPVEADQERIAGEGGDRRVRRIVQSRRRKG